VIGWLSSVTKPDSALSFELLEIRAAIGGKQKWNEKLFLSSIRPRIAGRQGPEDPKFLEVLKLLGIGHRLHHKPRALSGGEQQRVAIARAIVNDPAILLADEPTGNLDSKNSEAVLGVLRDLNERLGQTILMITHDAHVASYGHRIVHMLDGEIVGTP